MYLKKPAFWDYKGVSLWAIFLLPITIIYSFLFKIKKKISREKKFKTKIICIGNIYVGGTGKTPLADKVSSLLKKKYNTAIIKKKYKNQLDEILLLKKNNRVFISRSREHAIRKSIKKGFNCVILDDGLQDLGIKKNITIACFSSDQGIGNGLVIPSGPLRENLKSLKEIDIAVINGDKNKKLENLIQNYNKNIKIFYSQYKITNNGKLTKKYFVFSGIGNNINFLKLLKKNKIYIHSHKFFPDHYPYSKKDIAQLKKEAYQKKLILLTTEKDYLRLTRTQKKNINFAKIKLKIEKEKEIINKLIS